MLRNSEEYPPSIWCAVVSAFILMIVVDYECNTVHGLELIFYSGLFGFCIVAILLFIIYFIYPRILGLRRRKESNIIGLLISVSFLAAASSVYINRIWTKDVEKCYNFEIVKLSAEKIRKSDRFHMAYLKKTNNSIESVNVSEELYNQLEVGDNISVCLKRGILGYEFISRVDSLEL